jgi:hypothetical protein
MLSIAKKQQNQILGQSSLKAMETNNKETDEKCGEDDRKRCRTVGLRQNNHHDDTGSDDSIYSFHATGGSTGRKLREVYVAFLKQHEGDVRQMMKTADVMDQYIFDGKRDQAHNLWSDVDSMVTGVWEKYESDAEKLKTEVGANTKFAIILFPGENKFSPGGQPEALFDRMSDSARLMLAAIGAYTVRLADDIKLLRNGLHSTIKIARANHHPANSFVRCCTVKHALMLHKERFNVLLKDFLEETDEE